MTSVMAAAATAAIPLVGLVGAQSYRWRRGRGGGAGECVRRSEQSGGAIPLSRKASIHLLPLPPQPTRWERVVQWMRYGRRARARPRV